VSITNSVVVDIIERSFTDLVSIGGGWNIQSGIVWNTEHQDNENTLNVEMIFPHVRSAINSPDFEKFCWIVVEHYMTRRRNGEYIIDRGSLLCDNKARVFVVRNELNEKINTGQPQEKRSQL